MSRTLLLIVVSLVGCGGAVAYPSDPSPLDGGADFCSPPTGDEPGCSTEGAIIYCPEAPGQEWQLRPDEGAWRVELVPRTKHAIGHVLCEVAPDGFVVVRAGPLGDGGGT